MKRHNKTYSRHVAVGFIFLVGTVLLLWQHSYVGMYFDDYGNASLSYGYVVEGVKGTNWSIMDIIEWARWCYVNFGGRILYAVTILIPLLKNGIKIYMFMQALVIVAELWLLYRIICHYKNQQTLPGVAAALFMFYGILGIELHSRGTYWASASILYVWPLLPFFFSIWLYIRMINRVKSKEKNLHFGEWILLVFSLFFACCSQEQVGGAVIVFYVFYILFDHIKELKVYRKYDCVVLLTSIVSYGILFCAPGNFVRLDSNKEFASLGLIGKIVRNFPRILEVAFIPALNWLNLLLAISMVLMSIYLVRKNKAFYIEVIISTLCLLGLPVVVKGWLLVSTFVVTVYRTIFIFNLLVLSCFYFTETKRKTLIAFVISGGASIFCLLFSPYVVERNFISYVFVVMMVVGVIFSDAYDAYKKNIVGISIAGILCLGIGLKSVYNYSAILNGYKENSISMKYNHKVLSLYDENQGEIIELRTPDNTIYRAELPCDPTFEYISYWMHEYYDIPENVVFVWQ